MTPTTDESVKEEAKLTHEDMQAIFHILLKAVGGNIIIPDEVLEAYPKKVNFVASHDEVNKRWHIFTPRKRVRKLIVPDKRILVPG